MRSPPGLPEPSKPAILVTHPSDDSYGADRMLVEVLDAVADLVEPIVVLPDDTQPGWLSGEIEARGWQVRREALPVMRRRYATAGGILRFVARSATGTVTLARIARRSRCVAIHSNTAALLNGPLVALLAGCPHVWHIHEIIERPRILGRVLALLVSLPGGTAVGVSKAVAMRIRRDGGRMPRVLLNPAPELQRMPMPAADDPIVLMAGRVNGWKGHDVFVDAATELRSRGVAARFRLVGGAVAGRTEPYDALERRVRSVDPGGTWLTFAGHSDDLAGEMAAARLVVLPSTAPEPLSITALEAMMTGRPVVASRIGGLPEVVADGVTGVLVPPRDAQSLADAIARLLADPEAAERMGAAGHERAVNAFAPGPYREAWRSIYRSILDRQAGVMPRDAR